MNNGKIPENTIKFLEDNGFFNQVDNILDIGCGDGRFASHMRHLNVKYYGIDAMKKNVRDACFRFKDEQNKFKFFHIDVKNESYNPNGIVSAEDFKIPAKDASIDRIICHSLFTHLGTLKASTRYMNEIKRVLKKDGKLWITFFSNPPNMLSNKAERTVYSREFIEMLLDGFEVTLRKEGLTTDYHDQLQIMAVLK